MPHTVHPIRQQIKNELSKEKDINGPKLVELMEKEKKLPGNTPGTTKRDGFKKNMVNSHHKQRWFSEEERLGAVAVYATTGNSRRTQEITGIPDYVIRRWKGEDWWPEYLARIHAEQDEEIDVKFTSIVNKALDQVVDRIDQGDYTYDVRKGHVVRVPVKARDLAVVSAVSIDKRQLLRGQPTSRVQRITTNQRLDNLMTEFKKFASARQVNVIDKGDTPNEIRKEESLQAEIKETSQ